MASHSSTSSTTTTESPRQLPSSRSTWLMGLASAVALWLSFAPVNLWPIAWIATAGWCWLIAQPQWRVSKPYRLVYFVGLIHWLLVMQSVRLPHWSAYFGWVALAAYLAIYLPLFVGLSRVLVHQRGWPLCFACPIVWTGLEVFRSYFLSGFALTLLGHTQVKSPTIIQVAEFGGAYAVSFLLILVAASVVQAIRANRAPPGTHSNQRWAIALSVVIVIAAVLHGRHRLSSAPFPGDAADAASVKVALIQGSIDTAFDNASDPQQPLKDYRRLTESALKQHSDVDLIVWPESMYQPIVETAQGIRNLSWLSIEHPVQLDPNFPGNKSEFVAELNYGADLARQEARWFARNFHASAIVGTACYAFGDHPVRRYNSALWLDESGSVAGRYDKMHPVLFGEYVPLGDIFPWLYRLTPMSTGLDAGTEPLAVHIKNNAGDPITFSPCICFENTVPHLLRRQVRELVSADQSPDALITITNDGWFWGSEQLDFHFACGVFRAVEMRRPMLIAANTGFSAWIDNRGRIRERGPRRAEATLIANIGPNRESPSWYQTAGDWGFGFPCFFCCGFAAICGWRQRREIVSS